MRRFLVSLMLLLLGAHAAPAHAQQEVNRCAQRFPDSTFETSATAGTVAVHGSGLPETLLERYANDFTPLVEMVQEEMGGLDGDVAVCIFSDRIPLDAQALGWPEGQFLRAAAFGEERLVVLSSWLIGQVPDAGRNGLLHIAQYQISDGSYPEPFGNDVKGWYRNRIDNSVEIVHGFFVRQNIGLAEPWQPFPWTVGQMVDPLLWNPEFGYGGAGDFSNYAVTVGGTGLLADPFSFDLPQLDEAWRQSLFDESGSVPGGSKGWLVGLGVAAGLVLLGIAMAWWGRRQRKIMERKMRDLGWMNPADEDADEALVRTSVAVGEGGRDPGVGRRRSDSRSVDGDDGDGSPSGSQRRSRSDRVTRRRKSGDDRFRHPGFDRDD